MVVADGFTLVEPLADVEVKVPGPMATLVAPLTDQLSVLLAPTVMVAGFTANEVIAGVEPFPGDDPDGMTEPQPKRPMPASETTIDAHRPIGRTLTRAA